MEKINEKWVATIEYIDKRAIRIYIDGINGLLKLPYISVEYSHDILPCESVNSFIIDNMIRPLIKGFHGSDKSLAFHAYDERINDFSALYQGYKKSYVKGNTRNIESSDSDEIIPGLFFGGGKDSILAAEMLTRLFPGRKYALRLHMHHSEASISGRLNNFHRNFDGYFSVRGFEVMECKTNFAAALTDSGLTKHLHAGLYPSLFVPMLKNSHINQLSFGFDGTEFYGRTFYRRGRPDILRHLGHALSDAIRKDITFRNYNYGFPPLVAFKTIARNWPEVVDKYIRMCEAPAEVWCHNCRKCFHFVLFCLACNIEPKGIDISRLFRSSYFDKLNDEIFLDELLLSDGSVRQIDRFSADRHLPSMVGVMNSIDINFARKCFGLDEEAFLKFEPIWARYREVWRNDWIEHLQFWRSAYNFEKLSGGARILDGEESIIENLVYKSGISICDNKSIKTVIKKKIEVYEF